MGLKTRDELEASITKMVGERSDEYNACALISVTEHMVSNRRKYIVSLVLNFILLGLLYRDFVL